MELWKKHENRLCWWNVDLAKETGKRLDEAEKRERLTGSNHSRCFESITARMFGKAGEVAVVDVLEHEIPGRLAVFGDGSESGGCNERAELNWLCRAIWRKRRALKREKHVTKIKESAAKMMDKKHHGGWTGCVVGGSFGVCGIKGVLGRERKTCDRTQICSSQHMSGEVETGSEFFMDSQVVEAEQYKNYNVAGLALEFECLDDGQGQDSKRQNCKLECENGGERHRRMEWSWDSGGDSGTGLVIAGSRNAI